ncbi:MAG TPA: ADP-ribosylglycohydrolase family protein [Anaerolineales bacterium]|nr:ADP-ribosylglycohydrolase family protein [Anaerolineales bacterium]
MKLPSDYTERVYAGVLGKIIGVYLGRPFEGWTYERIMAELGEIQYYVHDKLNRRLIVTDDDISGTFTFLRAIPDYDNNDHVTAEQIGQTWLNYIIENRSILWWGGMGNSTEHTAYLRLKSGIPAPRSGSAELNGKVVAEQIGAQIFIDGWGLVSPGDPEGAADLARRAASVSHDGEAIYGAQVIAAMEAQAFVESNLQRLLDTAIRLIPAQSIIYRMICDLREWREKFSDWHETRQKIVDQYGYDRYGGNCHMIPNHALIHLGLLYGDDDFQKSLMITNTSGWDTDCNSGNLGCLLGIKNGLAVIDHGPDWRGPVADRLYLPTADGGRTITDAVSETYQIVHIARAFVGDVPLKPKNGARFHFSLPGSVQGFTADESSDSRGTTILKNTTLPGTSEHGLAICYQHLAPGRFARAATPTFIPPADLDMPGYQLMACPTLYPGQQVKARIQSDVNNPTPVKCKLYLARYEKDNNLVKTYGPQPLLHPGDEYCPEWQVPPTDGSMIAEIGLELSSDLTARGTVYLDYLTWDGSPDTIFTRPPHGEGKWWQAWVKAVSHFDRGTPEPFRPIQDNGRGLLIQGCREWQDYRVSADITPRLFTAGGIAARVQGLKRFYALMLCGGGKIRLLKALDGDHILGEAVFAWHNWQTYQLTLDVQGNRIRAFVDDSLLFDITDARSPLFGGAIALVCEEGSYATQAVKIEKS